MACVHVLPSAGRSVARPAAAFPFRLDPAPSSGDSAKPDSAATPRTDAPCSTNHRYVLARPAGSSVLARQPSAASQIIGAVNLPLFLLEGVAILSLVFCLLIVLLK